MRILHVVNAWPTDRNPVYGIFIKEQIDSLNDSGIESRVFFINAREKGKSEYFKCRGHLKRLQQNYDLIHYHHIYSAYVGLSLKPGTPTLVSFLSDGVNEITYPLRSFFPQLQYRWVINNSTARIFKKGVPAELSHDPFSFYLPNGVNTEFFRPMDRTDAKRLLGLDTEKRYLLFVSFYDVNREEKRYWLFQQVISILKTEYGHSDLEELVIVKENRDRVPLFFNAASAHLLTSSHEGSPNSVKESLSCNTPVVSTDVGNVREMLFGCSDSFVATGQSAGELAHLTDQVLRKERPELRSLLEHSGLTIKKTAERLKYIYNLVLNN